MTNGFVEGLREQGIYVSEPRWWPINWINFRMHPCPNWGFVEHGKPLDAPIVLCRHCYVVLDGWHRLAKAWRSGQEEVLVQFADQHWMDEGVCRVDQTNFVDSLSARRDMGLVSTCYHKSDWDVPVFNAMARKLITYGDDAPLLRIWEHVRAVMFLGSVARKRILDVGSRESIIPQYLAAMGAEVTAIDVKPDLVTRRKGIKVLEASVLNPLPFPDRHFDFVLCTAMIKSLDEDQVTQAMQNMARVTKQYLCITTDFANQYFPNPSPVTTRALYDAKQLQARVLKPSGLTVVGPTDFERADWNDWPIQQHAVPVYEKGLAMGVNVQVVFAMLSARKRKA